MVAVTASLESPGAAALAAPRWYTHRLNRPAVYRAGAMLLALTRAIHVRTDGDTAALAQWVSALEAMIRRAPEQWFNFFDVWRAAPAS